MDEKKVREAIEELKIQIQTYEDMIFCRKHFEPKNDCGSYEEKIAICKTAIEALEKQLPMMTESAIVEFAYGTFEERICPKCEEVLEFGKYCPNCGQRLTGRKIKQEFKQDLSSSKI